MNSEAKAARGIAWVLLEKGGQQAISFIVFAVVARLIGPEEYGLAGLCLAFPALAVFIMTGIVDAVISRRLNDDKHDLTTLFWAVCVAGIAFSGLLFVLALPLAHMFSDTRYALLLEWLSFIPALSAFSAVPTAIVQNNMHFKIFALRSLVSSLLSGCVGIWMAFNDAGALAIVAQQIVQQVIINFIIWPSCHWRPRFSFSFARLSHVLAPGMQMTASTLLNYSEQQLPRLIIGYVLGPLYVGYYTFATRLFMALRDVLVLPLTTVFYPALAKLRDDRGATNSTLHTAFLLAGFLVFPSFIGAIITAPVYVPLFFGNTWIDAISFLQIFLLSSITVPFVLLLREVMRSQGRISLFLNWQIFYTLASIAITIAFVQTGLNTMAWALAALSFIFLPALVFLSAKHINLDMKSHMRALWNPALATILMCFSLYTINHVLPAAFGLLPRLLIVIFCGFTVFGLSVFLFARDEMGRIQAFFANAFPRKH